MAFVAADWKESALDVSGYNQVIIVHEQIYHITMALMLPERLLPAYHSVFVPDTDFTKQKRIFIKGR